MTADKDPQQIEEELKDMEEELEDLIGKNKRIVPDEEGNDGAER